jgi:cytosine deaminase
VDAHIHLDKALLDDRAPSREGSLAEALRVTGEAKRGFTREDISSRARRVLDMAIRQGTTAMRSHAEIDPIVGLVGFEALAALKREYAPAIDLQLCAFAQEGILEVPGTEELLREALRAGADLVGGVPYVDGDPRRHVDIVFDLAAEFGVDVDFHADFFDEPQHLHARYIAEQTVRRGWQGRVALGHMSEMAALPPDEQDALARQLAEAGVAVIVLPATDLYLMGRKDVRSPRRGLAPIKRLLAAGVTVAAATNNVRNAFTPLGTAGLPLMGYLVAIAAHMGAEPELGQVLDMLTTHPARILRRPTPELRVGAIADLVVWDSERSAEIVSALAACRLSIKAGRVAVEHTRSLIEGWRAT